MPATTLWWDGWTVAKNTSDAEAEATFIAMAHAIRPEILNDTTSTQAVWLIDGWTQRATAWQRIGVFAAANAGSTPYPMVPPIRACCTVHWAPSLATLCKVRKAPNRP